MQGNNEEMLPVRDVICGLNQAKKFYSLVVNEFSTAARSA